MKHVRVNVERLAWRLRQAVGTKPLVEVAAAAKVHPSRVTRFLNGEFMRMTPVLKRVCSALNIPVEEFLEKVPAAELPPKILITLQRIVGHSPARAAAATRLLRSLESLTIDNPVRYTKRKASRRTRAR